MGNVIKPNTHRWLDFNDAEDQSFEDEITENTHPDISVDVSAIQTYLDVVFGYLDEGFIPLRSFPEKSQGQGKPHNIWIQHNDQSAKSVQNFSAYCHQNRRSCFCIPGLVKSQNQAKADDIIQMGVLLLDIDHGDIEAKLSHVTQCIGMPTLIVKSGGITADNQSKLHLYWKLSEPAEDDDLQLLLKLRHELAIKVGGDVHFQSAHQPIRIAGSIHHKKQPRRVEIQDHQKNEYHLSDLEEIISEMPDMSGVSHTDQPAFLDFNTAADRVPTLDNVLSNPVQGGDLDDWSRFEGASCAIGHFIRMAHDGRMTRDESWQGIVDYNQAMLRPPWPLERLISESDRLWRKHCEKFGEPIPRRPDLSEPKSLQYIEPVEWQDKPVPERDWVISQWLPKGYVTAVYGDGGVGKSLLVQQWLTSLLAVSGKLDAIYFEEVRRHLGTDAAHTYGAFWGHLSAWSDYLSIPYEGVPVGTIKKHVTGKGNANKQTVLQAVTQLGHQPQDDNEADALALLHWVLDIRMGGAQ